METERVAAIPTFADLPENDLAALARVAFDRELLAGDVLVAEGDFGHALFVIEAGTAEILKGEEPVDQVGPGDIIGEMAVLSSGRRVASVRATSPMTLVCLFKRDVWALDRRAPAAAQRLLSALDEHRVLRGLDPA